MKNKLIIILVVGVIFILYRLNPSFDDHVSKISSDYFKSSSITEEPDEKIRQGLDYKNFIILSVTQDKSELAMVSVGIINRVKVIDDEWAENHIRK